MERHEVEETLALLQAQCAVHHLVLKTLVRRDPDALALLDAWREIRNDAAIAQSLLPADARHSRWLAEQIDSFAEEWTAELADLATQVGTLPATSTERIGLPHASSGARAQEEVEDHRQRDRRNDAEQATGCADPDRHA